MVFVALNRLKAIGFSVKLGWGPDLGCGTGRAL